MHAAIKPRIRRKGRTILRAIRGECGGNCRIRRHLIATDRSDGVAVAASRKRRNLTLSWQNPMPGDCAAKQALLDDRERLYYAHRLAA